MLHSSFSHISQERYNSANSLQAPKHTRARLFVSLKTHTHTHALLNKAWQLFFDRCGAESIDDDRFFFFFRDEFFFFFSGKIIVDDVA
jgi:hypothetical protein